MITAATLKSYRSKDLAQMAKEEGVPGWHSMRKEQLVRALLRAEKRRTKSTAATATRSRSASASRSASTRNGAAAVASTRNGAAAVGGSRGAATRKSGSSKTTAASRTRKTTLKTSASSKAKTANGKASNGKASKKDAAISDGKIALRRIQKSADRELLRDLSTPSNRHGAAPKAVEKDRVVMMVRDSYWLHVYWEFTRQSIERAKAALAEHWHTAQPVIRLIEVEDNGATSTAERVVRDVEIHGGVNNWYVDVYNPPRTFRAAIGYLDGTGRFFQLLRSNAVTTPQPGSSSEIDQNWTDVARNYEKVYAMSGGLEEDSGDLQELFEERLRRPMGAPIVARYGVGADGVLRRGRDFNFEVDAEMIIYGQTSPDAYVTLANEPVKLRADGTFTVRLSMPDRRQVLPIVASSGDGVEQRTTVLAIERNTKVMEPKIRDPNEP
ncbi:DUF4912 domain-containing protein [Lignipirellula cremea]|uniref:Rho termination factor-like N-terminal domain-containing protein n=1 Tax=Lignipirellula cremea TaxID=2528010 RepID=A0A518E368_9BACT|nr:DUF4912 domain-containing protein [Lignipirellula cremea]QDU98534.1 hypothetical protein Pla8534_64030 [Lignipirellula cremea]